MKKISVFLIVLFLSCDFVAAQTYYYKLTSKVDSETDVRSSYSGSIYLTFTNNQNVCYESDKNGNQMYGRGRHSEMGKTGYVGTTYTTNTIYGPYGAIVSPPYPATIERESNGVFEYSRTVNNMYEFKCYYYTHILLQNNKESEGYLYFYTSTDLNRINMRSGKDIIVGERATPPGQALTPTQMY